MAGAMGSALFEQALGKQYPASEEASWRAPVAHREWPALKEDTGGTLMVSDDPERVTKPGMLFSGTLKGKGRLFFYHVNGLKHPQRLLVYALAEKETAVAVERELLVKPSRDYLHAGRRLSRLEAKSDVDLRGVDLKAGRPTLLLSQKISPKYGELAAGILDLETQLPVQIRVVMIPHERKAMKYLGFWPFMASDHVHARGTFPATERVVTVNRYTPDTDGEVALTLADGSADEFLVGLDEADNTEVRNFGNYGLCYRIRIPSAGTGRYRIYFNPQGGCYAGDIEVHVNGREALVPLARKDGDMAFGTATLSDTILLADVSAGADVELVWVPAAASFLPVRLWLVPVPDAEKAVAAAEQNKN